MYGSWKSIKPTIGGEVMILLARVSHNVMYEHDTSPNLVGVAHVHPLHVVVAHKSKMEVSPDATQTGARPTLDDAAQQS